MTGDVWCGSCGGEGWVEVREDEYERCSDCGGIGLDRERTIDALGLRWSLDVARASREERRRAEREARANTMFRRALRAIVKLNEERTEAPKMEPRVEGGKVVFDLVPDDLSSRMAAVADRALREKGKINER